MSLPDLIVQEPREVASVTTQFKTIVRDYTLKNYNQQSFVRVKSLKDWFRRDIKRADALLRAAYQGINKGPALPIQALQILNTDNCALLVFSILLELDLGHYIDHFWARDILDARLPVTRDDVHTVLRGERLSTEQVQDIAGRFVECQYVFCPVEFELWHRKEYGANRILPFLEKSRLSKQGLTAEVWQISVPEDSVTSELASQLHPLSRFDPKDDGIGARYHLALKTFTSENVDRYRTERQAFDALSTNDGMLRCFGHFDQDDEEGNTRHHLILEYGQYDLDEYFAWNFQPGFPDEILRFWNQLSDVVGAVGKLHTIDLKPDIFYGCHADIKPDNILMVHGKFKLADPGFASFVKKVAGKEEKQKDRRMYITGGTATFGAPEYHQCQDQGRMVPQSIDIWSLGCVLSIAATWVLKGGPGMIIFEELRQNASVNMSSGGSDCFHDGTKVLSAVLDWHKYLRYLIPTTDTLTGRILTLVEQHMLCQHDRLDAQELHKRMKSYIEKYEKDIEARKLPTSTAPNAPIGVIQFLETRRTQTFSLDDAGSSGEDASAANGLKAPGSDPRRARNSERVHRSQFLPLIPSSNTVARSLSHRPRGLDNEISSRPLEQLLNESSEQRAASTPQAMQLQHNDRWSRSSDSLTTTDAHLSLQNTIEFDAVNRARPNHHAPSTSVSSTQFKTSAGRPSEDIHSPRSSNSSTTTNAHLASQNTLDSYVASPTEPLHRVTTTMTSLTPTRMNMAQLLEKQRESKKSLKLWDRVTRTRPDELLEKHFDNRDIVWLIDNASSMSPIWHTTEAVVKALIKLAKGQDKDGMDMSFTLGNRNVTRCKKVNRFQDLIHKAAPSMRAPAGTDMKVSLSRILDAYLDELKDRPGKDKKLTIMIVTDGKWEGMRDQLSVKTVIVDFYENLTKIMHKSTERQVGFQFIQIGDDQAATERLQYLDDELARTYNIPDWIDVEHCNGDVYKMLLGSFVEVYDLTTPESSGSPTLTRSDVSTFAP